MDKIRFVNGTEIVYAEIETLKEMRATRRNATFDIFMRNESVDQFKKFIGDVVGDTDTEESEEDTVTKPQDEIVVPKYASLIKKKSKGDEWFNLKDMHLTSEPEEVDDAIVPTTKFSIKINGLSPMGDTEVSACVMEDIMGIDEIEELVGVIDDDEFAYNYLRPGDSVEHDGANYTIDKVTKYKVIVKIIDEEHEEDEEPSKFNWTFKKARALFEDDEIIKLRELGI